MDELLATGSVFCMCEWDWGWGDCPGDNQIELHTQGVSWKGQICKSV